MRFIFVVDHLLKLTSLVFRGLTSPSTSSAATRRAVEVGGGSKDDSVIVVDDRAIKADVLKAVAVSGAATQRATNSNELFIKFSIDLFMLIIRYLAFLSKADD